MEQMRGTTIVAVRKDGKVAICGDGQVSTGNTIMKHTARKVRRIYKGKVLVGFAGGTADAFALFEKFEKKLEQFQGNLTRSAVELALDWRKDKAFRHLEAMMIVVDATATLIVTGNGDVIESDDDVAAIGSGGGYALTAGRVLLRHSKLSAAEIAKESIKMASEVCVFTNNCIVLEEM